MKFRVRSARYADIFHIEGALQDAIEQQGLIPLPPIERPHIYNFLNYHIPRGEVMIVVADGDLAGFATMEVTLFPWNSQSFVFSGALLMRKGFSGLGGEQLLIAAMAQHAFNNHAPLVFRPMPGMASLITPEELLKMGAILSNGFATFMPSDGMEKPTE